jgi:methionyl-tRNA formyltransferase
MAPKITPEMVRVRWSEPAVVVDRLTRGASPAPGAWTTFRGKRLKLGPVRPTEEWGLEPGELRSAGGEVYAGTATTQVRLGTVQAEGKPAMAADAWLRGLRLEPGDRLE